MFTKSSVEDLLYVGKGHDTNSLDTAHILKAWKHGNSRNEVKAAWGGGKKVKYIL